MGLLSDATSQAARAALGRAFRDARRMPGNLLAYERLDELIAAARQIVAEIERRPVAPRSFTGLDGHPIDAAAAGLLVGRRLELSTDQMTQLGMGLFLQDIGLLALPPAIVHKAGPLADDERELMRRHPVRGLEFLRSEEIESPARSVVRHHHERWDGAGYPNGLAGEQIPLFARIAAVAETFTAGRSQPAALGSLRDEASHALDPELVDALCDVVTARTLVAV
jgi:HD-GYP domain-containing protein (c-di-GMP phosphodiesterase class II)